MVIENVQVEVPAVTVNVWEPLAPGVPVPLSVMVCAPAAAKVPVPENVIPATVCVETVHCPGVVTFT